MKIDNVYAEEPQTMEGVIRLRSWYKLCLSVSSLYLGLAGTWVIQLRCLIISQSTSTFRFNNPIQKRSEQILKGKQRIGIENPR